jgi:hypothetical protein
MWFLCGVVCANTQQVKLANFLVELISILTVRRMHLTSIVAPMAM